MQIFEGMIARADYQLTPGAAALGESLLAQMHEKRHGNFGNARAVRNFFERSLSRQADRLSHAKAPSRQDLCTIDEEDLPTGEVFS